MRDVRGQTEAKNSDTMSIEEVLACVDEPETGRVTTVSRHGAVRYRSRTSTKSMVTTASGPAVGVTPDGRPFILEVNMNPCVTPDAGFAAAAREARIAYEDLIQRIATAPQARLRASA